MPVTRVVGVVTIVPSAGWRSEQCSLVYVKTVQKAPFNRADSLHACSSRFTHMLSNLNSE